jgi:hypothetical protein
MENEAEQRQKAREQEEQQAKDAVFRAEEAAALKKREEEEATAAAKDTGGITLADTGITVQSNGTTLVKLTCLGIASCHGKLTLTAKSTAKEKGEKKIHTVPIATVGFSIAGDEMKAVKVNLNATGRALLNVDHGRLSASLMLLQSSPAPAQTNTDSVHLVQQKEHS